MNIGLRAAVTFEGLPMVTKTKKIRSYIIAPTKSVSAGVGSGEPRARDVKAISCL